MYQGLELSILRLPVKTFCPTYFVCKSSQKKLLHLIYLRIDFFLINEKLGCVVNPTFSCIHWTISAFWCIYSTPMCWQYIASRCAIISVSRGLPTILPASKQCLNLQMKVQNWYQEGSKSFCLLRVCFVNKCPQVRYPSISFNVKFYEVFEIWS
jgi:hypothetical protein